MTKSERMNRAKNIAMGMIILFGIIALLIGNVIIPKYFSVGMLYHMLSILTVICSIAIDCIIYFVLKKKLEAIVNENN